MLKETVTSRVLKMLELCYYCHIALCNLIYFLQWHTFLDSEGRIMDSEALRKRIFYGGVEHKLRKEVCICCILESIKLITLFDIASSQYGIVYNECRFGHSCWNITHTIQHMQRGSISRQWRKQSLRQSKSSGRFVMIYL